MLSLCDLRASKIDRNVACSPCVISICVVCYISLVYKLVYFTSTLTLELSKP